MNTVEWWIFMLNWSFYWPATVLQLKIHLLCFVWTHVLFEPLISGAKQSGLLGKRNLDLLVSLTRMWNCLTKLYDVYGKVLCFGGNRLPVPDLNPSKCNFGSFLRLFYFWYIDILPSGNCWSHIPSCGSQAIPDRLWMSAVSSHRTQHPGWSRLFTLFIPETSYLKGGMHWHVIRVYFHPKTSTLIRFQAWVASCSW